MGQLLIFEVVVGVIVVAVAAALTAISIITRNRMMRRGHLPEPEAEAVREDLIKKVGDASTECGMRVSLHGYWRGFGYTAAQRYVILAPLLKRKLLHAATPGDQFEVLATIARRILSRPVGDVILNSRDWQRLASGTAAGVVIKEITGSVIQVGNHNAATLQQDVSSEYVERLIEALRADARAIGGNDGERADSLADSLEIDLRKKRWTSIRQTLTALFGIAASSATVWVSTIQILNS